MSEGSSGGMGILGWVIVGLILLGVCGIGPCAGSCGGCGPQPSATSSQK